MKNNFVAHLLLCLFLLSLNKDAIARETKISESIKNWQEQLKVTQSHQKIIELKFLIAQGNISLKEYVRARVELEEIIDLKPKPRDSALAYQKLGNLEQLQGNGDRAIKLYQQSISQSPSQLSLSLLNSLLKTLEERVEDRTFKLTQSRNQADKIANQNLLHEDRMLIENYGELAFNKAKELVYSKKVERQELLSAISALIFNQRYLNRTLSHTDISQTAKVLGGLPSSRKLVFVLIDWSKVDRNNSFSWLNKAINLADQIKDNLAKTYAMNALAHHYLTTQQLEAGLTTAVESQIISQSIFAWDSLFRSQYLTGQIYEKMGNSTQAVENYIAAIDSIENLVSGKQYRQIDRLTDFKTEIEPVYQNSLRILLRPKEPSQADLTRVIDIFAKLRLAQLRQYFEDNCLEITAEDSSVKAQKTAVLNSIILEDRTHFILEMPNGRKIHNSQNINKNELFNRVTAWRASLTKGYDWSFQQDSELFYDLIIRPFESHLKEIESIAFVHDGVLRNLPMSALHDGKKYLVEKYYTFNSLNLQVKDDSGKNKKLPSLLAFGLSNPKSNLGNWGQLESAVKEVEIIQDLIGGDVFINDRFTRDNFIKQVETKDYGILHVATHGYFSGSAQTSYLLTEDSKLSAMDLEQILARSISPIELLVLSACETAVGSEESLLGLAGIAAKSQVSHVMGSLWQVNDTNQLDTIKNFYQELTKDANQVAALARVQREQIELQAHPQKWAALSLVGRI